jgi:hypothetical protein
VISAAFARKPLQILATALATFLVCTPVRAAAPVLRVLSPALTAENLLRNPGFEQRRGAETNALADWQPGPKGFRVADGAGRNHSTALFCENPSGEGYFGAAQTLVLNRTTVAPLIVRGWSKAENVGGSPDNDYSLYVDLVYQDGTPLWGQTANFRCGTHDWQPRELMIMPDRPVKTVTLHCLFRHHAGRAWFDDVSLEEIGGVSGPVLFQGAPVQVLPAPAAAGQAESRQTEDGLLLKSQGQTVTSINLDGQELAGQAPGGFLVRDVAAGSDIYAFEDGRCPALGLQLQARCLAKSDHLVFEGRLSDTTGKDRAVMLAFALPVDAAGWRWADDIRRQRPIQGRGEFANQVGIGCGSTTTLSQYPLAAICNERCGLALAIDMAQPAQYRLVYHAGTRQFLIAYDFGLVPETARFPGAADFRFVVYRFDPAWGFRAAFDKLTRIFPGYFLARSKEQGLWMPFTDISKVQGWQDFGFKYHEGNNNVPFDDANGILSFRYTEPMTWWMKMAPALPRTAPEAARARDQLADASNASARLAKISRTAAMFDAEGQPSLRFLDTPWCNGAVWSLNPNPYLPGELNGATVHWSEAIKDQLYGPKARGALDGEYLDSLEGYVTADLNFRREHFRYTTVPLTFASDTKQPALYKGLAVFEFTKWISDDVHRLGKLMFANGVPYRYSFLCPWLDVLGTETDWLRAGKYQPASHTQMCLWRTLSGQKPYLLLMNTDYNALTPDLVERYFQRSLLYGMFPGMFSHNAADNPYWQNPKWYNRDRALFKKYIPVIQRLAAAGWQPVTHARSDNDNILVERFGPDATGSVYFTLLNDTDQPQTGTLRADAPALNLPPSPEARDLLTGESQAAKDTGWPISLAPQAAKVLHAISSPPIAR